MIFEITNCKEWYVMNLTDKVAIVTGGSNGIGEAIANKLKELGAKVIIFDIKEP